MAVPNFPVAGAVAPGVVEVVPIHRCSQAAVAVPIRRCWQAVGPILHYLLAVVAPIRPAEARLAGLDLADCYPILHYCLPIHCQYWG